MCSDVISLDERRDEMEEAGYSEKEIAGIKKELDHYLKLSKQYHHTALVC